MKSDEEFIAGIYRKAEERKVEEVKDDAGKKPHFRASTAGKKRIKNIELLNTIY